MESVGNSSLNSTLPKLNSTSSLFNTSNTTYPVNTATAKPFFVYPNPHDPFHPMGHLKHSIENVNKVCGFYRQVSNGPFSLEQGMAKLDLNFPRTSETISKVISSKLPKILKDKFQSEKDKVDKKLAALFKEDDYKFNEKLKVAKIEAENSFNEELKIVEIEAQNSFNEELKVAEIEAQKKIDEQDATSFHIAHCSSGKIQNLHKLKRSQNMLKNDMKYLALRGVLMGYLEPVLQDVVDAISTKKVVGAVVLDLFSSVPNKYMHKFYSWYNSFPNTEVPSMDVIFFAEAFPDSNAIHPAAGVRVYENGAAVPLPNVDPYIHDGKFSILSSGGKMQPEPIDPDSPSALDESRFVVEQVSYEFPMEGAFLTLQNINQTISGLKIFLPVPKTAKVATSRNENKKIVRYLDEMNKKLDDSNDPNITKDMKGLVEEIEFLKSAAGFNPHSFIAGGFAATMLVLASVLAAKFVHSKYCSKEEKQLYHSLNYDFKKVYGEPSSGQKNLAIKIVEKVFSELNRLKISNSAENNTTNNEDLSNYNIINQLSSTLPYIEEQKLNNLDTMLNNDLHTYKPLGKFLNKFHEIEDEMISKVQNNNSFTINLNNDDEERTILSENAKTKTPIVRRKDQDEIRIPKKEVAKNKQQDSFCTIM
jgi:hypothetical protein